MKIVVAIVLTWLLAGVEPAGAQKVYSLTVSHHRDASITTADVKAIFEEASKVMKRSSCDVTFELKGTVRPFTSRQTPGIINTERQRDAVHRESTDVKVVKEIKFCLVRAGYHGCAFPPNQPNPPNPGSRSIIVTRNAPLPQLLWPHEIGHRAGLPHRSEPRALMTVCDPNPLDRHQVQITREECNCFLNEGSCTLRPEQINTPVSCAAR